MIPLKLNAFVCFWALSSVYSTEPPSLNLPSGRTQGTIEKSAVLKRQYAAFYSIPYAEPPIGERRFKDPAPFGAWTGTLMATQPPPVCLQLKKITLNTVGSEDCLYLNVFTPQLPRGESVLLDVIFLIHGGAFMISSGNAIRVEKLMDRDVVVVTFNYRLGVLGFLSTEDEVSPGNSGLKDQSLALKWTKENIVYFGGDPDKITISGYSAGAASVHYHMLSKMSKGLFHRAILESGSALNPWALRERPRDEAVSVATALGCQMNDSVKMIECLRKRPADHIVLKEIIDAPSVNPIFQFVPSVEPQSQTAFLDKHPREAMAIGEAADVPILASFSKDEGLILIGQFLRDSNKMKEIDDNWTDYVEPKVSKDVHLKNRRKEIARALKQRYLGEKSVQENKTGFVRMMSDWAFYSGIEESMKMMAQINKSPVYSYQFSYRGRVDAELSLPEETYQGVGHCEQTLYVTPLEGSQIPENETMLEVMLNLTMKFIKGELLAKNWKPVKEGLPMYSLFNISTFEWEKNDLEQYEDFSSRDLWNDLKVKSVDHHSEL